MGGERTEAMWIPRAAILLLFLTAVIGIDRLAFRDISHFYTPLYDYVSARMHSGGLPLWNPLDHTGLPLAGETTTAVFYPLRWLLFALPLPSDICLSFYVVVHLLIAATAAHYTARQAGVSAAAAVIAAVLYVMSGSVLFLYTNPPFLVGAAWLPFVLSGLIEKDKGFAKNRYKISAAALAMMVLGGDPQTALHSVIAVSAVAVARLIRNIARSSKDEVRSHLSEFHRVLKRIGLCAVVAAVLALPQVAASFSWSSQSARVVNDESDDWLAQPAANSRRDQAFEFSVAPWHALDFLTPNAFGLLIPSNHRLSLMLSGEGKMWTPSLYMGMLVVVALFSQIARRQRQKFDVWMGLALATWFVAMGHFGLVWFLQIVFGVLQTTDSAAGGLYWWLYHFFPGYDSLRYPAKWLPLTAIALSILTARFVDQTFDSRDAKDCIARKRIFMSIAVVLISLLGGISLLRLSPTLWNALFEHSASYDDRFWGPLDIGAGIREIQFSLLHSLLILFALAVVLQAWAKSLVTKATALRFLLIVVTIDLFVFGSGIIYKVNRAAELKVLANNEALRTPRSARPALALRTRSGSQFPDSWQVTASEERMLVVESSLREASFGRWHLWERQAVFNSMVSIRSRSVQMFWNAAANQLRNKTPEQRDEFWQAIRNWLAIDGVIQVTDGTPTVFINAAEPEAFYRLSKWAPDHPSEELTKERTEDFEKLLSSLLTDRNIRPTTGTLEVIHSEADSAVVLVDCYEASSLKRNVYQDGHWRARLISLVDGHIEDVTVERSEFLKQRIIVPAGQWQITFWYMPWWMIPSIVTALIGWGGMVSCFARSRSSD